MQNASMSVSSFGRSRRMTKDPESSSCLAGRLGRFPCGNCGAQAVGQAKRILLNVGLSYDPVNPCFDCCAFSTLVRLAASGANRSL